MKKIIIIIGILFTIVISSVYYFNTQALKKNEIMQNNKNYEEYYNKEITGRELASLINKVIDSNEKNVVQKDENNTYISNEYNSIQMDVKFKDSDIVFNIEKIYNLGIDQFILNYNTMNFKCSTIDYHEKTANIKYMYFEEI